MNAAKPALTGSHVAVITPTLSRPGYLDKTLRSLALQTVAPGRVLVADGGGDARPVVEAHAKKLPVEWVNCPRRGQIDQRAHALQLLDDSTPLVVYLDDRCRLRADALEQLIQFWNARAENVAGVSFNVSPLKTNPDPPRWFAALFLMPRTPPGVVLRSGYATPVSGLHGDVRSEWLCGGATSWRLSALREHAHPCLGVATRWATCEDLIFSYPLGKKAALYICGAARADQEPRPEPETLSACRFRGYNSVAWRYFFVARTPGMSKALFFWMVAGMIIGRLALAAVGRWRSLGFALGHAQGLAACALAHIARREATTLLR